MTGADIIRLTRFKLDDMVGPDYGWKTEELVAALNEAQDQLMRAGLYTRDRDTLSICTIAISSGSAVYTLSPTIIMINEPIWLTTLNKPIWGTTEENLYARMGNNWSEATGEILSFIADLERKKIRFYPIPNANETATLDVYRTAATRFTEDNLSALEPEIDESFQYALIYGTLMNAYDKADVETKDMPGLTVATQKWADALEMAKREKIKRRSKDQRQAIFRGLIC